MTSQSSKNLPAGDSTSPSTLGSCTPSIAGSPRWSRAALHRCVPSETAGLWRFESDREITIVAAAAHPEALAKWPVGTRTPVQGNTIAALVHRSGRPARIDSYDNVAGPIAAR